MGIFSKFKKQSTDEKAVPEKKNKVKEEKKDKAVPEKKDKVESVKQDKKKDVSKPKARSEDIKGKTEQAYKVLIKPLITEKASDLNALNKYAFAVSPKMNKIEIKKAIRTIYDVDPVKINIANFSGKNVRYGRIKGRTKSWKKAVVTLKPGDKIEVYEGV